MTKNVGKLDRTLRIGGGLILVGLAATGTAGAWAWLGLVPLATGTMGWCPPYSLMGWNTCAIKK